MLLHDTNVNPSPSQSFSAALARVMRQVEYHCFADIRTRHIDPFYKELCLIISEVLVMNPQSVIKINGTGMPSGLVQEVYALIRCDHVRFVFENFQMVSCQVFNKKAYLRTALYNAVFELESHYINVVFCDRPID